MLFLKKLVKNVRNFTLTGKEHGFLYYLRIIMGCIEENCSDGFVQFELSVGFAYG